jgi:hypothetical protein
MISLTVLLKAPLLVATFAVATPAVPDASAAPTMAAQSASLGGPASVPDASIKYRFACTVCHNTCDFYLIIVTSGAPGNSNDDISACEFGLCGSCFATDDATRQASTDAIEEVRTAVEYSDMERLSELVALNPAIHLNEDRAAIQFDGCSAGSIAASIPVPRADFASLRGRVDELRALQAGSQR